MQAELCSAENEGEESSVCLSRSRKLSSINERNLRSHACSNSVQFPLVSADPDPSLLDGAESIIMVFSMRSAELCLELEIWIGGSPSSLQD